MTVSICNTLLVGNVSPAKAGTPYPPATFGQRELLLHRGIRLGVPPSGGQPHANSMTVSICNALVVANVSPAKAGTPYCCAGLSKLESETQQGMKELEGMVKCRLKIE
jgi:hypothetical protein